MNYDNNVCSNISNNYNWFKIYQNKYATFQFNILVFLTDESVRWRQNSWDEVTQSTTINERHTPSQKSSSSDRDPELSSEEESNKCVLICYQNKCKSSCDLY